MNLFKVSITVAAAIMVVCSCNNSGKRTGVSAVKSDSGLSLDSGTGSDTTGINPDVPTVRLMSKGSILPSSGNMDLLFGAASYAKVEVVIKKIYSTNILQYMQFDTYESRYQINKVANQVADTTIVLGDPGSRQLREYKTYGLSLDELIKPEPGAIYHVELFGKEPLTKDTSSEYETYSDRNVDLLASDLALIAKGGDHGYDVFAYNILSGRPVRGAKIKLYDYAQQELAKGQTDRNGHISFPGIAKASFAAGTSGKNYAYLSLDLGKSLSTSSFDVGGKASQGGIKAYIFGERGVWRPGVTLHVSAVTMLDDIKLAAGHPVVGELFNPDGQLVQTMTMKSSPSNLYHFPMSTSSDAKTGRWTFRLTVGGQTFDKTIRIETVKPNKLDISLNFNDKYITPDKDCTGDVAVNWLYGAPGSKLKVDGTVNLTSAETTFKGYESYDFKDDSREFQDMSMSYKDLTTDDKGHVTINTYFDLNRSKVPGMLNADFTIRAFEPAGDFSTSSTSMKLSAFKTYVGIKTTLDKSAWGDEFLKSGKPHRFDVVTLNPDGKPVGAGNLHVEIFHVDWSWWWDASSSIANYMSSQSKEILYDARISTRNGKGSFSYNWAGAPEGLYFIRVTDEQGGHATSMLCQASENITANDASGASTRLNMIIDKDKYSAGQTARLTIPSAAGAIALITIEKGGRVLSTDKVECFAGSTEIHIPLTREMMPNVYAFVSLIQPQGNVKNDAPIRLYGIQNINVEDASSHLHPLVGVAGEVRPESAMKFTVKEKNGRAMSYVVAVVDEGLLSLTSFKTPDAWKSFYSKEALKVRTWDNYDKVIGAYGGHIEQLFAIGGDEDGGSGVLKRKGADRFAPVVAYLGPFSLKAGRTASHTVNLPQYIGQLRVMVIATDGKAQGSTAAEVNVSKPMMIQATMPRTLSMSETINVPATVIAMKKGVGNVRLSIAVDGPLSVLGSRSASVNMSEIGQKVVYFKVKVGEKTGTAHVRITAESAGDKSRCSVGIDILNPNPEVTRTRSVLLKAGESKNMSADLFGMEGTNSLNVELSSIPAINLEGRLSYLLDYPYGCIEQVISGAFPQLYLGRVMEMDADMVKRSTFNVTAAINKIQNFRRSDGALSYWPGSKDASTFGTVYALHFIQEAENAGYAVPAELKSSLTSYISDRIVNNTKESNFVRAYGLYSLAASGKQQRSAMNMMREKSGKMEHGAVWMLAASFAEDGKKSIAQNLTSVLPYVEANRKDYYVDYGSEDRNMAVALKTSMLIGDKDNAFGLAVKVASKLNDPSHYMSTQATAWSLYAISEYARTIAGGGISAEIKGAKSYKVSSDKAIVRQNIALAVQRGGVNVNIVNTGKNTIHAILGVSGIPRAGHEQAKASGIRMQVFYQAENGSPVDVDTLSRGATFKAVVKITNPSSLAATNLALSQKFPSGWEIQNDRLYRTDFSYPAGISYQDFRDDRVLNFFDLKAGAGITVTTTLTATYPGHFYLPAVSCEAMYDATVSAVVPGRWVDVK